MRIVKNSNNELLKIKDIEDGVIKSHEYKCINCNRDVIFVSKSSRAVSHFRHKTSSCLLGFSNKKERDTYLCNKMSLFHIGWQELFPSKYLEHKIDNHRADIYIESDNKFNLKLKNNENIFGKDIKKLVIEIQNSSISKKDLISRQKCYQNIDLDRDVLWIFNIENKCELDKIVLFNGSKIYLRLMERQYFQHLLDYTQNIILDLGGKVLFKIKNKVKLDRDIIEVVKITRDSLLQQLGDIISNKLVSNIKNINITYNDYDLETPLKKIKTLPQKNIDTIRYLFYLIVNIPYKYHFNYLDIFEIILLLNRYDKIIYGWTKKLYHKYRRKSEMKFPFGKYKGKLVEDIYLDNPGYIKWLGNEGTSNDKLSSVIDENILAFDQINISDKLDAYNTKNTDRERESLGFSLINEIFKNAFIYKTLENPELSMGINGDYYKNDKWKEKLLIIKNKCHRFITDLDLNCAADYCSICGKIIPLNLLSCKGGGCINCDVELYSQYKQDYLDQKPNFNSEKYKCIVCHDFKDNLVYLLDSYYNYCKDCYYNNENIEKKCILIDSDDE